MKMRIERIHHVQIAIPKGAEEQGRQFYCGVMELREIAKPAALRGRGGFWLSIGDMELHVGTEDGTTRSATKAHVAFQVSDLVNWKERLQAAGVAIVESVPIKGCARFEIRDPFGNRIEFLEPS